MIRYAILCAVSTEAQAAADKVSLDVQETRAREAASARGWLETAGVYRIPGESRTRYVNLSQAEAAMPDLRQALDDARDHKYDVLCLYDYDRLRDLLGLVSKSLAHYRVQLFAVNQPIEPLDPASYTPYKNDLSIMMEVLASLKQRTQTNDLRRKYAEAMPRRASQRGLPVQVPFGYRKAPNSKTPPDQDPDLVPLVVELKDRFLAGATTTELAEWMQAQGVAPKGKCWYRQTIKQILTNPFYAGIVRWGLSRAELDPRTGHIRRNRQIDPAEVASGPGQHQPLWDEITHRALLAEFARRGRAYKGRGSHALTSLLVCGECGLRLHAFYNSYRTGMTPADVVWRCSSRQAHVVIRNPAALHLLAVQIAADIERLCAQPDPLPAPDAQPGPALLALTEQRDRLIQAYSVGVLEISDLLRQKTPLDQQITDLQTRAAQAALTEHELRERRIVLASIRQNLPHLPAFLNGPPPAVNYALRRLLRSITVTPENTLELDWK